MKDLAIAQSPAGAPATEVTAPRRLLMVTTVANTAKAFLTPYADYFRQKGWRVELATGETPKLPELSSHYDAIHLIPWSRSIAHVRANLAGLREIRRVLRSGQYDIVHVHTPIASFVTRLAVRPWGRGARPKIIYTAHGFHFHRNGGRIGNTLFKTFERVGGWSTDALIVINREDEQEATRARLAGRAPVLFLPGIGIDSRRYRGDQFAPSEIQRRREAIGIGPGVPVVLMVAEFNPGKRHRDLLMAMARCGRQDVHVVFAGAGPMLHETQALAENLGLAARCRFLGLVSDVSLLCACSELMVLPSEREGLPRAVMEAMAAALPVIGADSRGIRDLLEGGCGLLFPVGNVMALAACLDRLLASAELRAELVAAARARIRRYEISPLLLAHEQLYERVFERGMASESHAVRRDVETDGTNHRRIMVVGGVVRSLVNFRGPFLRKLRDEGFDVLSVASDSDPWSETILRNWGIRYRQIAVSRAAISPLADVSYCRELAELIARERCAVVISYTHKPVIYAALSKRVARTSGVRCFSLISGLGYAFTDSGANVFRKVLVRWAMVKLYRLASGTMDGMIFQNADDQLLFRQMGILRPSLPSIVVSGSGIDLDSYVVHPVPVGPLRVLMVARLLSEKGIREWVSAARTIKARHPEVQFDLVGPRDPNPSAIQNGEIAEWENEGTIRYHGQQDDMLPFFHAASIYVLPSYREGTPRTVLEAMGTGRAIVTTDVPGCRETIDRAGEPDELGVRTGMNGFLIPARSVSALVAAIERFIESPPLTGTMGGESRRFAEEKFDVERVNREMMRFMRLRELSTIDGSKECTIGASI